MKLDITACTEGLVEYLKLDSIVELKSLTVDEKLIDQVGTYLLESQQKITTSIVAQLLGINRASIYNTYPKSAQYLQALIAQQKAMIIQKKKNKKPIIAKKISSESANLNTLDKEKIEKFMSIIMSLEFQKKRQENQINQLKSTISSLQSEINGLRKLIDNE